MRCSKERILSFMKERTTKPISLKELMRRLRVPKEEKRELKRLLKEMVSEGSVVKIKGNRYGPPSRMNLVVGELTCHPDGFGFVVPEDGGEDIFISPSRLRGAMHGDRVVARIEGRRKGEKREGTIIRILRRAHHRIVGRFHREKGFCFVVPADERIVDEIIIPPGLARGIKDGVMVVAEITRWPTGFSGPAGRIVEVLGNPEDPNVEVEVIVRKYSLPHTFPRDVREELKGIPPRVRDMDMEGREDLRSLRIVTIDGENARDFDDGVAVEKRGDTYRLWVSIADVSHYVKEGTAVDREAYIRGTSVYFPDRCIPMLPERLSNGICSLNPYEDRLTVTVELDFSKEGEMVEAKFYESVIRSHERLTYTVVKTLLTEGDDSLKERYSQILSDLSVMRELAIKLYRRRIRQGSIDFDLPEPQIILDVEGKVENIVRSERNIAHRIIEEFMLVANRAVAEVFARGNMPFLYRVHEEPDEDEIRDFYDFVRGLGIPFKPSGRVKPAVLQKILRYVEGKPEERVVNHLLLRSMKQACYLADNIGHFGLAFENYTHFTSPIRRYPDLVVHRLLKKWLKKRYTKRERKRMEELLPEIADHTSARERVAMEAEREVVELKKAQFMMDKIGMVFDGFISGVTSFGLFVELKEYFVEGLIHVSSLLDDYYIFDEKRHVLTGEHTRRRFRIGDDIRVRITGVNLERRRIEMVPVYNRGGS